MNELQQIENEKLKDIQFEIDVNQYILSEFCGKDFLAIDCSFVDNFDKELVKDLKNNINDYIKNKEIIFNQKFTIKTDFNYIQELHKELIK